MTDITQIRASLIKEAKVKKNVNFRFRIAVNNNIKDKEKNIEAIVNCPNSFSLGNLFENIQTYIPLSPKPNKAMDIAIKAK